MPPERPSVSSSGRPAGSDGFSLRRFWLGAAGRDPWHEGSAAKSLRSSLSLITFITFAAFLTSLAGLSLVLDVVLPADGPGAGSQGQVTAVRVLLLVDVLACVLVMSLVVRERARLAALGDNLAQERARAEETRHGAMLQAEHMRVVLGVAERLSGQVSVDDIAAVVTRAAKEITGAPDAILWISDPESGLTRAGVRTPRTVSPHAYRDPSTTGPGPVRKGNGWAVPLVASGETVGVLEMAGIATPPRAVETVVEALAAHAAGAVEMTNRYAILRRASFLDPLTGLPNRGALDVTLATECERATRTGSDLAVIMVDVDHFKEYNDRHGHQEGDAALAAVARVLATGLRRKGDIAYRYGGEEFMLVLPGVDANSGVAVAERLRAAVQEAADVGRVLNPITASFGVAVRTDIRTGAAQLIAAADDALYRAKRHGRNRVEVAPPEDAGAGLRPA